MSGLYYVHNGELEPVAPAPTISLVQITQHDYDLLTTEEKMNGTTYIIPDCNCSRPVVSEKQVIVEKLPKTCHKCGAPLVNNKCEYCGTEY